MSKGELLTKELLLASIVEALLNQQSVSLNLECGCGLFLHPLEHIGLWMPSSACRESIRPHPKSASVVMPKQELLEFVYTCPVEDIIFFHANSKIAFVRGVSV